MSTLVILRRMRDVGEFESDDYWAAYQAELERLQALPRGSGGDFYLTLGATARKRFARALVMSTLERVCQTFIAQRVPWYLDCDE